MERKGIHPNRFHHCPRDPPLRFILHSTTFASLNLCCDTPLLEIAPAKAHSWDTFDRGERSMSQGEEDDKGEVEVQQRAEASFLTAPCSDRSTPRLHGMNPKLGCRTILMLLCIKSACAAN